MQEFVTRSLSSSNDLQLPAGVVVRTVQSRESGFPPSVPPLRPLPSCEERARQLLNEMERSEKMLADPTLTPEGAQQLGLRIKELGGALEELLSCKGEAFGRKLWGEILGTGSRKSPGDQGYLLETLCGVSNERVHALVRGALTQCTTRQYELSWTPTFSGTAHTLPSVEVDNSAD
jgi:hypothetical protein